MKSLPSHVFRPPFLLAAGLTLNLLVAEATAQDLLNKGISVEKREFSVKSDQKLDLEVAMGAIEVKSHDKNSLTIHIEKDVSRVRVKDRQSLLDRYQFRFEQSDKGVTIRGDWKDKKRPRRHQLRVKHVVTVPKAFNLTLKTAGGSIKAGPILGTVDVRTSGGGIELAHITGDVFVHTSGGGITVDGIAGRAKLKTSGGTIRAGRVDGPLDATTSGGSIRVTQAAGPVQASTSGGSIRVTMPEQTAARTDLKTSGGSVELRVPAGFEADLDAKTSGGSVTCEIATTTIETKKKNQLEAALNGGGPEVRLRTSGGSIRVLKL